MTTKLFLSAVDFCKEKITPTWWPDGSHSVEAQEHMMQDILSFTIANWEKLEPLFRAQIGYAKSEGLNVFDLWHSKIKAQLKRKRQRRKSK